MQPKHCITVTGTAGTVEVYRGGFTQKNNESTVRCKTLRADGTPGETVEEVFGFTGMENELDEFWLQITNAAAAKAASSGGQTDPTEGLLDLAMIKALIRAGETGQDVPI